jgi:hypothetical protein
MAVLTETVYNLDEFRRKATADIHYNITTKRTGIFGGVTITLELTSLTSGRQHIIRYEETHRTDWDDKRTIERVEQGHCDNFNEAERQVARDIIQTLEAKAKELGATGGRWQ